MTINVCTRLGVGVGLFAVAAIGCVESRPAPTAVSAWELGNPVAPIPALPLGITSSFSTLPDPPRPERVRLGRWLFYDTRLSVDGTVACATCHRPENAFSEPTPVSTGIGGQKGGRKAPTFINAAWTLYPNFFWDGRAASLEDQALGPVQNPIEMGNTVDGMIANLRSIESYGKYFEEAFGEPEATPDRVAKALADYERTRVSGNSAWDRWRSGRDESAVSAQVKEGHELFFGKAKCNQCHLGQNFTDSSFHNLGVGWDPVKKTFADPGRHQVTKRPEDQAAFKTPTLRDVSKHAPYMHDGSMATLREVVDYYNRGGEPTQFLDPKVEALKLTSREIDALVAFMHALDGEGYADTPPAAFPQ